MNKYIVIIIICLSLVTAFSGCVGADYIILGDTVYYGNTNFNMSVSPHTLYESEYVDFSFILYNEAFNNTLMDGFWLFNTSQSYPSSTNYSGDFIHKSISWNGWTDLYAVKNVSVKTNKYYNISAYINLKFNTSGKYCFGVKKSSVSWSDAWANGEGNPNGFFWIDPWWNSTYEYNKRIILNSSQVPTTLYNFPVCINISSDAGLSNNAQPDGDDIVFMSDDNLTKYNHEIEYYDDGTGRLVAWVNITTLSSVSDTILFMYYGNADATNQENIEDTWNGGYELVYHMTDVDGGLTDSTNNDNDATEDVSNPPDGDDYQQPSIIGYSVAPDGEGNDGDSESWDFGSVMNNDAWSTEFTIEALSYYVQLSDELVHYLYFIFKDAYVTGGHRDQGTNDERAYFYTNDGSLPDYLYGDNLNINTWNYQAWRLKDEVYDNKGVFTGSSEDVTSTETDIKNNSGQNTLGCYGGSNDDWGMDNGRIDEFRISNVARSDDWIVTTYASIFNATNGSFFTLGSEIVNLLPVVYGEVPLNNSVGNTFPSLTWNCTIYDDHTNINWSIECSNGEEDAEFNDVDGYKSLSLSGLEDDTEYFVYVNVSEYYGRSVFYWYNFTTLKGCKCLITNPFPVNDSVDVNFTYVNMTIDINSSCGIADFVNISLVCVSCSTMNYTNFTSVSNGTYFLNISGLNGLSSYIWYVNTSCNSTHNYTFFTFTTKLSGGGCDCDDIRVIMRQELNNYNAFKESDDMNIGFEMEIIGLLAIIIFYLLLVYRKDFVFGIFCSVISWSVGLFYLGNTVFSIYWWLGVILFLVCLYSSFLSVYYALSGRYFDTLNK